MEEREASNQSPGGIGDDLMMMMMKRFVAVGKNDNIVVVTRHKNILRYLEEVLRVDISHAKHIKHAKPSNIRGRDVIGTMPLHLAAQARTVTVIPLRLPEELRGKELTFDEVCAYAEKPETYSVEKLGIADWMLETAKTEEAREANFSKELAAAKSGAFPAAVRFMSNNHPDLRKFF